MNLIRNYRERLRALFLLPLVMLWVCTLSLRGAGPEPAGWYSGDMHVHANCGIGNPTNTATALYNLMVSQDFNVMSLLADMGNGEVQTPAIDLPKVNGQNASVSTSNRIVHWDAEWHWDSIYTQYPHQALGGHIVGLGLTNASQIWNESTYAILNWARQQGGVAGFAHFQFLDDNFPTSLSCCTPIEYPAEVALGACDFISEDIGGSDSFIHAYYRLLNCGFRPGFAAGSDYPCGSAIGQVLTYSQVAGGQLTYSNWLQGIKNGRTVVSRNGRKEFVDLKVNTTSGPGDEIKLTGGGTVPVSIQWTATQTLSGTLELVRNGVVVASQAGTAASGAPVTFITSVNFTNSGWLCARRMDSSGHQVHTAAVFVTVDQKPVRASASDAQFYVQWMNNLLQNTSSGGVWASFYPTGLAAEQARYSAAKSIFQQIALEAGAQPLPVVSIGNGSEGASLDNIWYNGAWINAGRFQAASNMTVTAMEAKVAAITGHYKCAIYTDSGGQPSRLLGSTIEVSTSGDGWQAFPLTSSVALTNGNYYWLGIWSDDANAEVYYSDSGGMLRAQPYAYGAWPNPIVTSYSAALNYCIYATGAAAMLTNIMVTPTSASIPAGNTQQFVATGMYSDGSTQNLTSQATWSSSSSAVATINASGLATAVSTGKTTISATLSGVSGGTALTVQVSQVAITTGSLPSGTMSAVYSAALAASAGTTPYIWSLISGSLPLGLTLNATSGAISGIPTATGTFNFTAQVSDASSPTQTVTKSLSITIAPILTSITVTPVSPTFFAGATQQFTATGTYSDASTQNLISQVTWASSNTVIAVVSAGGLATAVSSGSTIIAAVLGGITGSTTVTILTPPAGQGDYRSVSSGDLANAAIWETNNGTAWLAASRPPTNSSIAGVIRIRNGHTVTVVSAVTVDQFLVEAGGQLTVSNTTLSLLNGTGTDLDVAGTVVVAGSSGTISNTSGATIVFQAGATYQHASSAGTIPTATWNANSTCWVTGAISALPGGLGQLFGHFMWSCASQSANLSLEASVTGIAGNLTVSSTGSGALQLANGTIARSLNVGGDFIQTGGSFVVVGNSGAGALNVGRNLGLSGGTFSLKQGSGAANLNVTSNFSQTGGTFNLRPSNTTGTGAVTANRDFSLSSGTFNMSSVKAVGTLNVGGNFSHTGGSITETSSGSGAIIFTSGLHTNTSGGTVANTINFTVNSSATLMLGTSVLGNGSVGTFTLASGGTLGIGDPAGITTSGASGNIRVTGTRSFNTGANYVYNGTAPQVPGNGLPTTVSNLTIASAGGLTLSATNTVNGTCLVASGARVVGAGTIRTGQLMLSGTLAPGVSVGRFTTARETWNGGASYIWEINNATGTSATGWDLLSLTNGQGIDLQAASTNPFALKLVTLNGTNAGLAANFSKSSAYTWTIAIATNATITNFSIDKFVIDTTQFSNDFGGGTFSADLSGSDLRIKFAAAPAQLSVSTALLPNGTANAAYVATLTAAGGITPYAWSLVSGSLPPGLTLNATNGSIVGAPSMVGSFNFTVQVSDVSNPVQYTSKALSITIVPALVSISVTPASPSISTGVSQQFTATGTYSDGSTRDLNGQATWTSSIPAVATIDQTGLASGISTGTTTISATVSAVSGSTTLAVQAPLVVMTTSLLSATVGTGYTMTITASGGNPPYSWSLASGLLPAGLTLNTVSGAISGTPTAAGISNFTVFVSDASNPTNTATKPLSLTVAPALVSIAVTPANPTNQVGSTQQFTATGTYSDGTTQTVTSQAAWASSNTTVATINSGGLCTAASAGGSTISASLNSVRGSTLLTVQVPSPTVTTTSLPNGVVSTGYSATLTASAGTTPYVWSLTVGSLPPGLTLNAGSGVISGTPTSSGTFNFTARVTDSSHPAQTADKALTITTANLGGAPGLIGNSIDAASVDYLWTSGPWINAGRFLASSNMTVAMIQAKVGAVSGNYKCAIYTDNSGQPNRLLGSTTQVSNPATGWQTFLLGSSMSLTNGQYYWLAIWSDDANARVYYSASGGTLRAQSQAYGAWPDPVSTTWGTNFNYCIYATGWGPIYFGVVSVSPAGGAWGVGLGTPVTATFTSDMDASTINANTVFLRDPSTNLVPASVIYDSNTKTATLTPASSLNAASTYAVTVRGGASGVASLAGGKLSADFSWTFTTDIYGDGPGGPILILTQPTNSFSRYFAEILLTEGLNEFALTNLASVSSATLANYDVVILGQSGLTPAQVTMFSDWVNAGGKLIAMRPDKQLAGLLGLTDAATTLSEGYLLVNTASGPGAGIVNQTIQFHGTADRYNLGSATSLATLYNNATNATTNPAVTLRNVGANGGQAAAFTFDLARSIVYTRQGNPAWAGQERDGITPMRSDDLFYGASTNALYGPPTNDWVNLNKVAIPQADEQQRLLANMILSMNSNRKLLPRFWYFPHGYAAVVVMTGDDHAGTFGGSYAVRRFNQYLAASSPGGSVDDWEVPRCTAYIFASPKPSLTNDAQVMAYQAAGFEISVHLDTGCVDYTPASLSAFFSDQLNQLEAKYPSVMPPTTHRIHCIAWSGYTAPAEVSRQYGIRLETSYYYWPQTWITDRPGLFTGSGMAMRFAATNGTVIDVYQAATQMTDESGQTYPNTVDTMLDHALGVEGYYGAFVANMHTDADAEPGADAILSSALSRGVPVISARQLLTWLDARNGSSVKSINWNNGIETFAIDARSAARGLQGMVPIPASYTVSEIRYNGSSIGYSLTAIKGIRYAFFPALTGNYQVTYLQDSTPPTITSTLPANGATGVSTAPQVQVTFNEGMDSSSINTNTIVLLDSVGNPVSGTVAYNPATLTATLSPKGFLKTLERYSTGVAGGSAGVRDFAGNSPVSDFIWNFTTTNQTSYSLWRSNVVPGLADAGADSSVELGVKFRSDAAGSITGIRFYKASANTGTHVAHLWTSTGTLLASATFTGETASGWQQVNFPTPVAISANTVYVASYHVTAGHYSLDTNYFATSGVDNGPLHALASGVSGGNGVYVYGTSTVFPSLSWSAANYWVDVVFK